MKRFFLFSVAALFLSACGDDATTKFTAASGTITAAVATTNLTTLQNGAQLTFTGAPAGTANGAREDFYASCVTKAPTTKVDADGDHIGTQTRTYACTNVAGDTRAYLYTQNGTATETDKDDADPKSGWKFEYDITGGHNGGGRGPETWEFKGFWELTKATTSFTYASDYKSTNTNTRTGSYVGGGTWSHTVTPTDMANPFTGGGAITFGGFYAYTFTVDSVQTQYVFKMTSENLTYGAGTCTNFFNAGSYTYTDGGGNLIKVTHTDCDTRTTTFNGTTI